MAVVAAVATALAVVPTVVLGAVALGSTIAEIKRTTSFDVGPAARVQVDARFGSVAIVAARDGRIMVVDQRAAGSITRASAAAALRQMSVDVSRQGDVVLVRQVAPLFVAPVIQRNSIITVEVPARTDVDVGNVGDLRIQGIDGVVHFQGSGSAELRDVTLRGASTLAAPVGELRMTNVTVAGSAVVTKVVGGVAFDGQLAPGGSSLDIEANTGDVTVALPRPTDARAEITTQIGVFRSDGTWLFTPDQVANPRRWTADLGPDPTGTVTVRTTVGRVAFASR
jgi:hypothetical protein